MKNVCDKYNRTIDSIRQLVSDSHIHVLIDVTNSESQLYPITQGYINKWLRQNGIIGNWYLIYMKAAWDEDDDDDAMYVWFVVGSRIDVKIFFHFEVRLALRV